MAAELHTEIGRRRRFELPEQEAFLNLLRTFHALDDDVVRLMKSYGLSPPQYNVLRIVRGEGGANVPCSLISRRMLTRVPDITRLIDRLERAGRVRRTRSDLDRRVVAVSLTDEGKALLKRMDRPVLEMHRRQLGHLSERELRTLSRLLTKARQRPDTAPPPAS